jgi:hypothetical protein
VEPFFLDGKGSEDYKFFRDRCPSARSFIEEAWPLCSEFLDADVREDARMNFHQRWWEVYLTYTLLHAGIQLVSRECRNPRRSGPDLLARVDRKDLWIEAVSASAGKGPDAVGSSSKSSKGPKSLQDKEIMLRFSQAFTEKVSYHKNCVKRNWVRESESYVVALNGALAERAYPCLQLFPRIIGVLLLGLEKVSVELEFDEVTSRAGELQYEFQAEIEKKSKNTVPLAAFLNPENSCVSAVIYSAADAYMTSESFLVLNPLAKVPLPTAFLSSFPRYWVDFHKSILHFAPNATGTLPGEA